MCCLQRRVRPGSRGRGARTMLQPLLSRRRAGTGWPDGCRPRPRPEHRCDRHVSQRGLLLGQRAMRAPAIRRPRPGRAAARRDPRRPGPFQQHIAPEQVDRHGDIDDLVIETLERHRGKDDGVDQTLLTATKRGVQTRHRSRRSAPLPTGPLLIGTARFRPGRRSARQGGWPGRRRSVLRWSPGPTGRAGLRPGVHLLPRPRGRAPAPRLRRTTAGGFARPGLPFARSRAQAPTQATHAAARDVIHSVAGLLEHPQHTDVGESLDPAGAEGEPPASMPR